MASQPQVVLLAFKLTNCTHCKNFFEQFWPSVEKEIKSKKLPVRIEVDVDGKNTKIPSVYRRFLQGYPSFAVVPMDSWNANTVTNMQMRAGGAPVVQFMQWLSQAMQAALNPPPPQLETVKPTPTLEVCSRPIRSRNRH